jgi:hypothetical protein
MIQLYTPLLYLHITIGYATFLLRMLQLYTPVLYIHKALGYAAFLFRDVATLHTSSIYI